MRLSDVLISKDLAVDTVRKTCQMILDKCATHYDEDLKDEVYDNTLEVDAVLRCNKYISIALNNLPARYGYENSKYGKWIRHESFDGGHKNCNRCIECSNCGTWFGADCYAETSYCPSCGAKMVADEK